MKNENSIGNVECDITGSMLNKNEEIVSKGIIREQTTIEKEREYCRNYHRRNEQKIKERRRTKFRDGLQRKLEKIKLTNPNPPTRKCPSCGLELYYTTTGNRNRSEKAGALCNSCKFYGTQNPSYRKVPHNKGVFIRTEPERKEMAHTASLKRNFGITKKEYNDMFDLQQGRCKICNIHRDELDKNLCVDHCHKSNKIRGLLCRKCNAGLGIFRDDINIVNSALKYLQSN